MFKVVRRNQPYTPKTTPQTPTSTTAAAVAAAPVASSAPACPTPAPTLVFLSPSTAPEPAQKGPSLLEFEGRT